MKHVIAIIQPQQLPAVKKSIRIRGIEHMSCTNILGTVPNQDEHQSFRGVEHDITLFQKVRLEFFVNDDVLDKLIEAISTGAQESGGTGKVFVSELQDVVSVGTGAHGPTEI